MLAILALTAAAMFTGAAFYINAAEHPARLTLEDKYLLQQWKPSYERGLLMQGLLAVIGGGLGIAAYLVQQASPLVALGGVVLLANWPYTMLGIMPTNNKLKSLTEDEISTLARPLILRWGRLHAVRTILGALSTACILAGIAGLSAQ